MTIKVAVDVDLGEFGTEYGESMTAEQVREHLCQDLADGLRSAPYSESLKRIETK